MSQLDCLVIGAAEQDRTLERQSFLDIHRGKPADGWGKFLTMNYAEYEGDALMSHQLASLAYHASRGGVAKEGDFFRDDQISTMSVWRIPLLGGMFIYQFLKRHGFEVELVQHLQLQGDRLQAGLARQPKVIAISTTLITSPLEMRNIVQQCRRESPDSFIVLGGMSIWNQYQVRKAEFERELAESAGPSADGPGEEEGLGDLMSGGGFLGADAMVIDPYGVETLAELVSRVRAGRSPSEVPNTVVFEGGLAVGPLVREGETFDHVKMRMNWDLVEDEHLGNIVNVRTQISCPFRCSFCSYPTTQGPVIKAEVEMFERELQALSRRGVERLMIVDDTFNVPPKRFVEILQVLRRYDFEWFSFIRCQFLKPELVDLMKESGCRGVYLGLESVDDETLKRMNKMATRDHFYSGVDMLAERDIWTQASFIVGFPGDTADTVMQIGDFIEKSALDYFNLKLFWYDAATPIGQRAREFDLTGQGYNWKHSTMDSAEAHRLICRLISETKGRYVGLHSGELWEIAHYGALGLERRHIDAIYDAHNAMLCHDLAGDRVPDAKQQIFSELTAKLGDLSLTHSPW